ncbi:RING finger protein nhl-1-like [Anneissia japonica]|uniref:RING finger protein nhl-1-like n=1 Tax=Anneissia japonica TaxID=1529436 RepID=UPI0014257025|nr:RING finger protein nhl-1-like [Anneissia japonica]
MSVSKALQFMDKKDLECAICLNRFHQPKTLKCMHTYCLQCIQKWVETHGKMKCPTCGQEHDLTKEDLKKLASNTMISQLLEYVMKIEDQKPTKCSFCDNQPSYHCSTCQLYLCGGNCIKQHKAVPSTKDHPLYTLDIKEQEGNQCPAHCNNTLEFYCTTCNKSACKQCEHIFHCCQKQHEVIPMSTAVDEFNKDANEIVELAHEIKNKLTEKLQILTKDRLQFDSQVKLCRTAIEIHEKKLIKKVQEKSKELISDLDNIYKTNKGNFDSEINDIDSKMTQLKNLIVSINSIMNKPEKTKTLSSKMKTIKAVKDNVLETDFEQSFQQRNIKPNCIPSMQLDELMNTEGIGKITTADSMTYNVAEDDEQITVTKGQPFVVKVSSPTETNQLVATLLNSSGEESATQIEYQEGKEYKITGRCNVEGNWKMKITVGAAYIKGSPVNIKVETLGLVHTIDNISDYKEHNKTETVTDVTLDRDGCILVSSCSKDILKFNQSGSFVARIQVPQDLKITFMHPTGDGHILFSDVLENRVVMCDYKFQEVRSIGKGMLEGSGGLTFNKETRALYVVDFCAHCIYKFNVDDSRHLGTLGSKGNGVGQMLNPTDVALTKEGHLIVADNGNQRIQMFDANDRFMTTLIHSGELDHNDEDGDENGDGDDDSSSFTFNCSGPCGLTIDFEENILVSSIRNGLKLFDKNGVFIKRIDHADDGLKIPCGIHAISVRPRRVAVADHIANNIKIFNY